MTGIQIQYLLGIWFTVNAISLGGGKLNVDIIRIIAGVALLVLALMKVTFI